MRLKFVAILISVVATLTAEYSSAVEPVSFERDILPTLEVSCFKCHSERMARPKADLRLDTREAILAAVEDLGIFEIGDGDSSTLIERISLPKGDDLAMPPTGQAPTVSPTAIKLISRWIDEGADFGDWRKFDHPVKNRGVSGLRKRADSIDPSVKAAAAEIDRLVRKQSPSAYSADPIDDSSFLRRTSLLVMGRLPTANELHRWSAGSSINRGQVVEEMLASPARVSHQFNYWANVLRATSKQPGNIENAWLDYLKQRLRENKPYDEWAHEMLTASGYSFEVPAVGLHRKDSANRLAGYEAAMAVFLGTQMGCAQCHDHPYEPITRREYFEMYGYFSQTHGGVGQSRKKFFKNMSWEETAPLQNKIVSAAKQGGIYGPNADRRVALHHITGHDQAVGSCSFNYAGYWGSRLPPDYQYDDGESGQRIKPKTLFGTIPPMSDDVKSSDVGMDIFAKWTTSPDNLKFTHVIANRLWEQVFGYSLMGPLTDVQPVNKCDAPELANYLAALLVRLDYDMVRFQEVLLSTRLYALQATVRDETPSDQLTSPALRRLSAEQIWDSLLTLMIDDVDQGVDRDPRADWTYHIAARNAKNPGDLERLVNERALTLTGRAEISRRNAMLARQRQQDGFVPQDLRRASELPQPAPAGHFLSLFGQAERSTIEDQWFNATTPQALTLLNGPLLEEIVREGSPLSGAWQNATPNSKVSVVYDLILIRQPSEAEQKLIHQHLDLTTQEDFRALAWSLINSREFLFLH